MMKRLFDIISTLCVLSVLAVPMLVIAIAIKLTGMIRGTLLNN
jgi:lipopolysaccharide/colanic/teichoic acid biosynthesis glycosyltransferase